MIARKWNVSYAKPIVAPTGQTVSYMQMSEIIEADDLVTAVKAAESRLARYAKAFGGTCLLQGIGEIQP